MQQLDATFSNGISKYYLTYADRWYVHHQCPCGHTSCETCIIPSTAVYRGTMHDKYNLEDMFLQEDPMPIAQAKTWWQQRTKRSVRITSNLVHVYTLRKWSEFCTFPYGRQLVGQVEEGMEIETLRVMFSDKYPNGVPKFRMTTQSVSRQCPCGLTTCSEHIFPGAISIHAAFPLVLKLRDKDTQFGHTFRMLDPMTKQEAISWFQNIPLKWQVEVEDDIHLRMICRCKHPKDIVPCSNCIKLYNCIVCHAKFKRADMKDKMCQNCHHKEMIECPHCKRKVPRGHYDCKPLLDTHYQQEVTGIYPPFMRSKHGKKGICLDCGDIMSYNVYHRHQYRRHHGVAPGHGYSRDYKLHKCTYCEYTSYDIHNVHTHEKSHILVGQHPCRHNCGATFKHHSAEVLHCKRAHNGEGLSQTITLTKRVGDTLQQVIKKQKH